MISIVIEDTKTKIEFTKYIFEKSPNECDSCILISLYIENELKESYKINVQEYIPYSEYIPFKRSDFIKFSYSDQIYNTLVYLYFDSPYLDYEIRYHIVNILDAIVLHELDLFGEMMMDVHYILTKDMYLIFCDTKMNRMLKIGNNEEEDKNHSINKYFQFISNNRLI